MNKRDFTGWAIVSSGNSRFLGRIIPDTGLGITLSPVFEYAASLQVSQQGVNRPIVVIPLEMMADAETLECAEWSNVIHVESMGPIAQAQLSRLVDMAEKMRDQLKQAASPIKLAKPGTVISPINGGRV